MRKFLILWGSLGQSSATFRGNLRNRCSIASHYPDARPHLGKHFSRFCSHGRAEGADRPLQSTISSDLRSSVRALRG